MPKRSRVAIESEQHGTPKKQRSSTRPKQNGTTEEDSAAASPARSILKTTPAKSKRPSTEQSPNKVLFSTPGQKSTQVITNPSGLNDHSARRRSASTLQERTNDNDADSDVDDTDRAVAQSILADGDQEASSDDSEQDPVAASTETATEAALGQDADVPVKRPRGRPKGKRKERTPTPPPDMPAHELYFFHNRTTASQTSTNVLPAHSLLNHEQFLAQIEAYKDPHRDDIERLKQLHRRSFEQWHFELDQGYNLCMYGMGSKRDLILQFVDYVHQVTTEAPRIVVVNGYSSSIGIKDILSTLASLTFDEGTKLPGQPAALLELIAKQLKSDKRSRIYLVIHNLDSHNLRKATVQPLIAKLASLPQISLIASCDSINFALLWDLTIIRQYSFLYHDATTLEPWTHEIDPVEEVNALLGRSSRKLTGKDGVGYVLRSLPENARNLFRILVAEQLALGDIDFSTQVNGDMQLDGLDDDIDLLGESDEELAARQQDTPSRKGRGRPKKQKPTPSKTSAAVTTAAIVEGVEYRTLYHKAVEDFICSSEVNFRTLLKEFHDHQMIASSKDAMGAERLIVPFRRDELEAILEEL